MSNQDFTKKFLSHIKPNHRVLDLGAGDGRFSQMFNKHGAKVVAVDRQLPSIENPSITPVKISIEDFCDRGQDDKYNLIFARNVLQFLDKQWVFESLFPWIEEHLALPGIIGLETFYRDPEPPFDRAMRSLYTLKELTDHFISWTEIYAKESDHRGPDLRGQTRKFFTTKLVIQKPK